jgi:hypothetical protein
VNFSILEGLLWWSEPCSLSAELLTLSSEIQPA